MELKGKNIGIVAGGGQFPRMVAQEARAAGARVFIYGFDGQTDPALAGEADGFEMNNIGQFGKLLKFFSRNQVSHLCMAGSIKKIQGSGYKAGH